MNKYFVIFLFLLITTAVLAQPVQWRGPNRDGKFADTGLLTSWPADGPELLLKLEGIGKGWSSVVATSDHIFASGMIDTLDYLSCFSNTGELKWKVPYGRSWTKSFPDTRSTPTIEDNRIYIISGTGELVCLNKEDGKINWKVNVDKEFNSEWHIWGVSESPLIVDDKVICTPGGKTTSVVAFDKISGNLIWKSESNGGPRSYASPTIFEYKNFRFILAVTGTHLVALYPENGKTAWTYKYHDAAKWNQPGLIWTNTPVFKGREIFLTMGYDYPSAKLEMDSTGTSVVEIWRERTFDNHHHGVLEIDGKIYGSNWKGNNSGKWVCMDWESGEILYLNDWINKGSVIYAEGLIYALEEKSGTVGLVKPDPKGFEVISSFKLNGGTGPFWAHPFIANKNLYLRHGDVLFVYKIN